MNPVQQHRKAFDIVKFSYWDKTRSTSQEKTNMTNVSDEFIYTTNIIYSLHVHTHMQTKLLTLNTITKQCFQYAARGQFMKWIIIFAETVSEKLQPWIT